MDNKDKLIEELWAALRVVAPHATGFYERQAKFYGDTYDKLSDADRKRYPFVLQWFLENLETANQIRQKVADALQHAEDFEEIQADLAREALEGSL